MLFNALSPQPIYTHCSKEVHFIISCIRSQERSSWRDMSDNGPALDGSARPVLRTWERF